MSLSINYLLVTKFYCVGQPAVLVLTVYVWFYEENLHVTLYDETAF